MQGAVDRLVDAEVLMVCGENLRGSLFGLGEADEIAENVLSNRSFGNMPSSKVVHRMAILLAIFE